MWNHVIILCKLLEVLIYSYQLKAEKHILPNFGSKRASEVSSDDVYRFIQKKQEDGLSNRYIADILIEMKSIFKYAVRKYHIVNPLDGITMPKMKRNRRSCKSTCSKVRAEATFALSWPWQPVCVSVNYAVCNGQTSTWKNGFWPSEKRCNESGKEARAAKQR